MKPLDRYKAMISEALGSSERLDTVDIDAVLAQARSTARGIVESQTLSADAALQVCSPG